MNPLMQAEQDSIEAQKRVFIMGDAHVRKAGAVLTADEASPTTFQPYPYRRYTRQEANVLEMVV